MSNTIVLIDDDKDDLDFLIEAIKEVDSTFTCISFTDPEKALEVK